MSTSTGLIRKTMAATLAATSRQADESGLEMCGLHPRRCLRDASWSHLASRRWERLRPIGYGVLSGRVLDEPALVFSASTLVLAEHDVGILMPRPGPHTSVVG
ncbi:hypothetical protein BDZ89DRAFT_502003 [Hymenopellis radicata]|nr:hypothetical protein BDZ89DRAFT_502003 [Hymenopellis radicata]